MRRNIFIIIALAVIAFCVLSVSCKNEVDEVEVDASYKELKEALQEIAGIEIPDIPGISHSSCGSVQVGAGLW